MEIIRTFVRQTNKNTTTMSTKLKISKVTNSKKYMGAYDRIFSIVNQDRIFVEVHEAEESVGLVGDTYFGVR